MNRTLDELTPTDRLLDRAGRAANQLGGVHVGHPIAAYLDRAVKAVIVNPPPAVMTRSGERAVFHEVGDVRRADAEFGRGIRGTDAPGWNGEGWPD